MLNNDVHTMTNIAFDAPTSNEPMFAIFFIKY